MPIQRLRVFTVNDQLRVRVPEAWRREDGQDIPLAIARAGVVGSPVFVDWNAHSDIQESTEVFLVSEAERFLNDGVCKASGRTVRDIVTHSWETKHYSAIRSVVYLLEDATWVFQLLMPARGGIVYLAHWNGPLHEWNSELKAIFDSLECV